jgi:hypothetical protein
MKGMKHEGRNFFMRDFLHSQVVLRNACAEPLYCRSGGRMRAGKISCIGAVLSPRTAIGPMAATCPWALLLSKPR